MNFDRNIDSIYDKNPDTLENEDINNSPIEDMIFDFDNSQYSNTIFIYTYHSLPLKGNLFPYIEKQIFKKIKKRKFIKNYKKL